MDPGVHAAAARGLDRRAEVGLEHHQAAALRRAVPRVVLRRLPAGGARAGAGPAGGPAGRRATRTRVPGLRFGVPGGRPGRDGHVADVVADPADQRRVGGGAGRAGPGADADVDAGAGVRDHQDLAVLFGGAVRAALSPAAVADGDDLRLGAERTGPQDLQARPRAAY